MFPLLAPVGDFMAKFMLSIRDENFKLLVSEADDRGISVQELIRAVIIPDWVKEKTLSGPNNNRVDTLRPFSSNGREPLLQPMGRLRT